VHKAHILLNNRTHAEIGKALRFGSMFGKCIAFFVSRDTFMTRNPSDVDRSPSIGDNPCLSDNTPCQILTGASEVGCAAQNSHIHICEDGVMTSWCNVGAESNHCFVDHSQFGGEHLLVLANIKTLTSPWSFHTTSQPTVLSSNREPLVHRVSPTSVQAKAITNASSSSDSGSSNPGKVMLDGW
jgi:hypothetical protein